MAGLGGEPVGGLRRQLGLRVVPGALFLLLSLPQLGSLWVGVSGGMADGMLARALPGLLSRALYLAFVWLSAALLISRPPARRRDVRPGAWGLAMLGTFGLVAGPLLPAGPRVFGLGATGVDVRLGLAIVSMALAIVALSVLGGAFGLTPEARKLVTAGPYRLVRHPLYLCESINIVGLALASGRTVPLLLSLVVLGAQVGRARLEEGILTAAFPEYPSAMRGVPHFLPGIY